jgi:hypothetical protein
MAASPSFGRKLGTAILGGLIVGISATAVDLAVISYNREVLIHQLIGDFIATLVAVLVCLALQLRNEELHYRFAMERAAIVAELNHHVRNAVFPLCLAVQRNGDAEALRLSNDAIERINVALQEAATDVFAMKSKLGGPGVEPVKEQRLA